MKRFIVLTVLLILISVSPLTAGSIPDFKDGNWEITTSFEMPGMPMSMPPTKHTQCITKEDMVPQSSDENVDCTIKDQKVSGNTVSWSTKCTSTAGASTGSGNITYGKDTFSGTFTTEIPSMKMKMTSKMKGRRIGPCK